MSLNLCIDWGNTNIKVALAANGKLQRPVIVSEESILEQVTGIIESHKPDKAILCSVSQHSVELEMMLRSKIKGAVILTGNTNVPINNAYLSADTLGADRLALVCGAHASYPGKNNLVISIGTCITYNLLQNNRTFRGGAISPGLQMRFKAMNAFTSMLPEVKKYDVDDALLLGYDTETCIQSGVVNGMIAEIDGMISMYAERYTDFNAILTGGDAPHFAGRLKNKIFADPDLLMKGCDLILDHNVPLPQ
ncbi:type III pantothenate kinase [Nemorincola caseinilytica]|uniref:Type III pantothenate kinase n=1 Tax=Nemorincola caseinilytica TaxID=2054315 RepID=A0ABP8N3F8_9BACT